MKPWLRIGLVCVALIHAAGCRNAGDEAQAAPPPQRAMSTTPEPVAAPERAAPPADSTPVRIAFVGDVNLGNRVHELLDRQGRGMELPEGIHEGFPFTHVRDRISEADIAVANLECVVSVEGKKESKRNAFRAPLSSIALLRATGFDVVSVANNHSHDYGDVAFWDMVKQAKAGGLHVMGEKAYLPGRQQPVVIEAGGMRIGFLGFHHSHTTPERAFGEIRLAREQVDVLIAFPHWGLEGDTQPTLAQLRFGRGLIDSGADLVVGTHAHVLQPEERYKDKLIAHGLGNFVFTGMGFNELHRTGGYLEVDIHGGKVVARRFFRVRLNDHGEPTWLDQQPREPEQLVPGLR